ncbi:MAG TPA: cysteine hydrolase family protein [Gammaproteobacteria bacterium]|nr:cysteine hydrolase family protein [Gammaproteobacteria bacterium]
MKTALLLIEIQNDYFPNGRMPIEKSTYVAAKSKQLLQAYRAREWPVIHVQHISTRPNDSYFLPCTKGSEFHPDFQPTKGEFIVKKHYPNSFRDTTLLNILTKNHINHLTICGMMTHSAIDATIKAAYDNGMLCTVLHDACATKDLHFSETIIPAQNVHHSFLASLEPIYATVLNTDSFLQMISVRSTSNMAISA